MLRSEHCSVVKLLIRAFYDKAAACSASALISATQACTQLSGLLLGFSSGRFKSRL